MEHLRIKLPWRFRHQTIFSDCTVQNVENAKALFQPHRCGASMDTSIFPHKSLPWLWAGAQLRMTLPGCEDEPCPGPVFTWGAAPWPQTVTLKQHP